MKWLGILQSLNNLYDKQQARFPSALPPPPPPAPVIFISPSLVVAHSSVARRVQSTM